VDEGDGGALNDEMTRPIFSFKSGQRLGERVAGPRARNIRP